jgi:hypothetical protein
LSVSSTGGPVTALWAPTATIRTAQFVSTRVRNYQFHPVWDFIADQAWLR